MASGRKEDLRAFHTEFTERGFHGIIQPSGTGDTEKGDASTAGFLCALGEKLRALCVKSLFRL